MVPRFPAQKSKKTTVFGVCSRHLWLFVALIILLASMRADADMLLMNAGGGSAGGEVLIDGFMLLETADFLLLESGSKICLEGKVGC